MFNNRKLAIITSFREYPFTLNTNRDPKTDTDSLFLLSTLAMDKFAPIKMLACLNTD